MPNGFSRRRVCTYSGTLWNVQGPAGGTRTAGVGLTGGKEMLLHTGRRFTPVITPAPSLVTLTPLSTEPSQATHAPPETFWKRARAIELVIRSAGGPLPGQIGSGQPGLFIELASHQPLRPRVSITPPSRNSKTIS